MNLQKSMLALLALGLLLAACGGPQATEIDEDELARAAKTVREELDEALRNEDVDAYLAFFMDDAVWMPPHSEEYIGKDAARQKLESVFRAVDVEGSSETQEQMVMGPEWIAERGQFSILLSPKQGDAEPVHAVGSYLALWHKDTDGKWKIAVDMWNSDRALLPPMGPEK